MSLLQNLEPDKNSVTFLSKSLWLKPFIQVVKHNLGFKFKYFNMQVWMHK